MNERTTLEGNVLQRTKECQNCFSDFTPKCFGNFKRQKYCSRLCARASKKFAPEQAQAAFWSRVQKTDACWLYIGARDKHGYGDVNYLGKHIQAHRLAWILTHGDPRAQYVLHKCDNPPCCKPEHLYAGTQKENVRDSVVRNRFARGVATNAAKVDEEKVRKMRQIRAETGMGYQKIGALFGASYSIVRNACLGKSWTHVK